MKIRAFYDTASFSMNITKKRSKGRRRRRHTHLASAKNGGKNGRKNGRKRKKKNCGTINSQQQQPTTTVLKQANVDGIIVESLNVESFGDRFEPM